jgi:hypothetical protein
LNMLQTDEEVVVTNPEEATVKEERPENPREAERRRIAEFREQALAAEMGISVEAVAPEVLAADDVLSTEKQLAANKFDSDQLVNVKVDGIETEVPLAEVIRSYQKSAAADVRLAEATRLLKEAKERATQEPATAQEAPPAPEQKTPTIDRVKQALDKLYEGDTDGAATVFEELLQSKGGGQEPTPSATVDIDAIAENLKQRLAVDTAMDTVRRDYPLILGDRDLEYVAAMKANAKVAEGQSRADAILAAADEMYRVLGKQPGGRPATRTTSDSQAEKLARKAAMDPVRAVTAAAAPEYPEAEEASVVIREMAAKRLGQSGLPPIGLRR